MKKEWFADWFDSPYYHILYQNRSYSEAEAFVKNLIGYLNPPKGSQILDVACGKGRHAKQLAELGFHVTGIDLSKNSINEAKSIQNDKLKFIVHDMRMPFHKNEYDFVFNFFTSFGYFDTEAENLDALKMMTDATKDGGTLVVDYLNAGKFSGGLSQKDKKEIDGVFFETEKSIIGKKIVKNIQVHDPEKGFAASFSEAVSLISLEDFNGLAKKCNLQLTAVFGNYDLKPFDESTSDRLIMIFSKNA